MSVPALTPTATPNTGLTRSAHLMRALGANAASVWSQLSPQEAEQLSSAMQALPEDEKAEQNVLRSYLSSMRTPAQPALQSSHSVWDQISSRDGSSISAMLQDESPQVIALILSKLSPEAAANTVRALPRSLATDALKRLLNVGDVHPVALKALEQTLSQSVSQAKSAQLSGGHEHVARIFDRLDSGSENALLSSLDSAEPGAGEKIRALMFTFDDLAKLDPASLQTILVNV